MMSALEASPLIFHDFMRVRLLEELSIGLTLDPSKIVVGYLAKRAIIYLNPSCLHTSKAKTKKQKKEKVEEAETRTRLFDGRNNLTEFELRLLHSHHLSEYKIQTFLKKLDRLPVITDIALIILWDDNDLTRDPNNRARSGNKVDAASEQLKRNALMRYPFARFINYTQPDPVKNLSIKNYLFQFSNNLKLCLAEGFKLRFAAGFPHSYFALSFKDSASTKEILSTI